MATTTATISLSSNILSQTLSLSKTMTLYTHGTTATGHEQMNYHRLIVPSAGTPVKFDLIEESAALEDKANYVYICNKNTDVTDYVRITILGEVVGSLYAGEFMMIPWSCANSAADTDSTIEIEAFTHDATVEYALFHTGETLVTQAD